MQKFLSSLILSFILLLSFPLIPMQKTLANGFSLPVAEGIAGGVGISVVKDGKAVVVNLLKWLTGILGFVFVVAIIVAGFMFIFSAGQQYIDLAKGILTYSIIGLIVALLAYTILSVISTRIAGVS